MTPQVALLVIGDGRDALRDRALDSFARCMTGATITTIVEVDDRRHDLGFCGAIQAGWSRLVAARRASPFDYVFHLEEDWAFLRPFALDRMCDLLDLSPRLVQVAFRRAPENDAERAAGGLVELWPGEYEDKQMREWTPDGVRVSPWLEHRLFFTTNPSVYRADLVELPWPDGPGCERFVGERLAAGGGTFAFWGARDDPLWIEHTGQGNRTGRGY
jgi:hypothetical protein